MVLDDGLLETARAAGARQAEAERQALLARAEYHTAIRRLHLGGASLREIAQALALSHQRVAQIVADAGGSWWSHIWRTRYVKRDAVCTFCDKPPSEVAKLIAGPNVFICDGCVAAGERATARGGRKARCSFCGKSGIAHVARDAQVCKTCLGTCRAILEGRSGEP
jgi:hypothetical protein